MKKVISLILSMAMVLSLTVLSFADEGETTPTTYSITINNSTAGHTYEAYQIFTGTVSASGKTLSNIEWGTGVKDSVKAALIEKLGLTGSPTAEDVAKAMASTTDTVSNEDIAKLVAKHLADTPTGSSIFNGTNYTINGLEAGYYLIKDQNGSMADKNDSYTDFILTVVGNASVNPKSKNVTSEKKVKDINDSEGNVKTGWQDSADYDIGDKVPFQLKGTVAEDYNKYTVYKFIFHDKMSSGLTFDNTSVKVYVDGNEIKSDYELVTQDLSDGCTFEVKFDNLKNITSVKAGSVITVEYEATLNENAKLGSEGNPNTSYLVYSNNPNNETGTETGKTPEDTVIVFTYKTIINKVDTDGNALDGATFKLEKLVDGTWTELTLVTETNSKFTFTGLDDGRYRITEENAPDGYNKLKEPIYFVVAASHDENADIPKLNSLSASQTDKDGNVLEGKTQIFEVLSNQETGAITGELSTDIENSSGTTLPETGGIGTTIFYVVGAVLVIGAGVLFVTKRRMSAR